MRPVELDLYKSYTSPIGAGDISPEAPPEPPVLRPAQVESGPPIWAPASVAEVLIRRPKGWPAPLGWPPAAMLAAIEAAAASPVGDVVRRAANGESVEKQAWESAVDAFEKALAPHAAAVTRTAARAQDFARSLTPPAEAEHLGFVLFSKEPAGAELVTDPRQRRAMRDAERKAETRAIAERKRDLRWRGSILRSSPMTVETRDGATVRSTTDGALACPKISPEAARIMVEEAMARGWERITIRGGEAFAAAIQAAAAEIPGAPPVIVATAPSVWERAARSALSALDGGRPPRPPAPPKALARLVPADTPTKFAEPAEPTASSPIP